MQTRFGFIIILLTIIGCRSNPNYIEDKSNWEFSVASVEEKIEDSTSKTYTKLLETKTLANYVPGGTGYLWIRKKIFVENVYPNKVYAVSPGIIAWADETYFNSEFVGREGNTPPETWNAWNTIRVYPVPANAIKKGENNIITMKVFVDGEGFIAGRNLFGEKTAIENATFWDGFFQSSFNAFVSFLFVVITAYHFLMYWKRRKDVENLYYSIFSMCYVIYCLNFVSKYIHEFVNISYLNFQKVIFVVMYGLSYSLFKFFAVFLKEQINKYVEYAMLASFIIPATVCVLVPDYPTLFTSRPILALFFLPAIFMIFFLTIRALFRKKKEAKALLYGLAPVLFVLIHDNIIVILNIQSIYLASMGLPLFLGSIMFILANKFVDVQNETDDLNANLENKVKERTIQVTKKMEEIQTLKVQQDGDYFLTSLIANPLMTNLNRSSYVKSEFIIDQKKKFQFRNKNAELGGDICITGNLRFASEKGRFVLFFNGDAMGKSMQGAGGAIVIGTALNNIIARSARNDKVLTVTPEEWLKETYTELDAIFKTFNGSMLISCVMGLINDHTGELYYFNAEHPWTVLFRDDTARFLENELILRKLGSMSEFTFEVKKFKLEPGDVLIIGSDGRDDLEIGSDSDPDHRTINEDENLFLRIIQKAHAELSKIVSGIHEAGKITDDLSLMRIGFQEDLTPPPMDSDTESDDILKEANLSLEKGERQVAKAKLLRALKENPGYEPALKLLVKLQFEDKQYGPCAEVLKKYVTDFPDTKNFWFELSVCYKHLRRFEESLECGLKVKEFQPQKVNNLLHIADNYRLLGDNKKSLETVREVLGIEPENSNAKKLQTLLV